MRRAVPILATIVALLPSSGAMAVPHNLYEWIQIAPIVVSGKYDGGEGKLARIEVDRYLRGEGLTEEFILFNLRKANRSRNYEAERHALKLEFGTSYVFLLTPGRPRKSDSRPTYELVRGTDGTREIPLESSEPFLDALERFVGIQDEMNERHTWRQLTDMLEDTNPMLVETALEQFIEFRRGRPELLSTVRPLLDHPGQEIRGSAAKLIGQIVAVPREEPLPDATMLRDEIVARARRDAVVSVRVAATETLNEFAGEVVDEILEKIADDDPDQTVRYTAERLLLDRPRSTDDQADQAKKAKGGA